MRGGTSPLAALATLVAVAMMVAGCGGTVSYWPPDFGVDVKNPSRLDAVIQFETSAGGQGTQDNFPSGTTTGGISIGCVVGQPTWLRIYINATDGSWSDAFTWSDVGCKVQYLFTYEGRGDATMVVTDHSPDVDPTGLPRK